jgi:hypothetical protein
MYENALIFKIRIQTKPRFKEDKCTSIKPKSTLMKNRIEFYKHTDKFSQVY